MFFMENFYFISLNLQEITYCHVFIWLFPVYSFIVICVSLESLKFLIISPFPACVALLRSFSIIIAVFFVCSVFGFRSVWLERESHLPSHHEKTLWCETKHPLQVKHSIKNTNSHWDACAAQGLSLLTERNLVMLPSCITLVFSVLLNWPHLIGLAEMLV